MFSQLSPLVRTKLLVGTYASLTLSLFRFHAAQRQPFRLGKPIIILITHMKRSTYDNAPMPSRTSVRSQGTSVVGEYFTSIHCSKSLQMRGDPFLAVSSRRAREGANHVRQPSGSR